ncbi:MAG TPA: hypothetical protein VFO85_18385 [Vicinamibacteria bacterium]|nr:hypothetical protein [Vicinamibacteria bacterium]
MAAAVPATAGDKIAPEFKAAWEGTVRKGQFAVVTAKGVPTTSVYGVDGQQTDAYFSVDVKGGVWQASQGIFDMNQVEADTLNVGEVMELAGVSVKPGDNRIDLRMVSVEAHKVKRADGRAAREPVSTNFKFFFPFPLRTRDDLPKAMEYVASQLRLAATEEEARAAAAQMVGGGAAAPGAAATGKTAAAEIKAGMTPLEVLNALGKPVKELTFQAQSKWTYPELTVIFENGRVKEVRF